MKLSIKSKVIEEKRSLHPSLPLPLRERHSGMVLWLSVMLLRLALLVHISVVKLRPRRRIKVLLSSAFLGENYVTKV